MNTRIKADKMARVTLPLTGLRPLYSSNRGKTLVLEVDVNSMRKVNEPDTINEMLAEAKLEYYAGEAKGFTDTRKLMSYLED